MSQSDLYLFFAYFSSLYTLFSLLIIIIILFQNANYSFRWLQAATGIVTRHLLLVAPQEDLTAPPHHEGHKLKCNEQSSLFPHHQQAFVHAIPFRQRNFSEFLRSQFFSLANLKIFQKLNPSHNLFYVIKLVASSLS